MLKQKTMIAGLVMAMGISSLAGCGNVQSVSDSTDTTSSET